MKAAAGRGTPGSLKQQLHVVRGISLDNLVNNTIITITFIWKWRMYFICIMLSLSLFLSATQMFFGVLLAAECGGARQSGARGPARSLLT